MRFITLIFFLCPFFLTAQSEIDSQFGDIAKLIQEGQIEKARLKVKQLKLEKLNDTAHATVLLLSAELEERDNNYEQVIEDNEALLKLFPADEKDFQNNIGRFKKNIGDFTGSEKAFRRVLELTPSDELIYLNIAVLYNSTNRYKEAITILRANPIKEKNDFEISSEYNQYAIAFLNLEMYDSARANIENYFKIKSSKKDEMIFYHAALTYYNLKDKLKACKYSEEANRFIVENKIDDKNINQSNNIKKRWFYVKYLQDIKAIKKSKKRLCS